MKEFCFVLVLLVSASWVTAQDLSATVDQKTAAIEDKVIAWRRDFHGTS